MIWHVRCKGGEGYAEKDGTETEGESQKNGYEQKAHGGVCIRNYEKNRLETKAKVTPP